MSDNKVKALDNLISQYTSELLNEGKNIYEAKGIIHTYVEKMIYKAQFDALQSFNPDV